MTISEYLSRWPSVQLLELDLPLLDGSFAFVNRVVIAVHYETINLIS